MLLSYSGRARPAGPYTDVGQLEFNLDGSFGLRDNTGLNTNIILNNGNIEINAATSLALSCGGGDTLTINGATMPDKIMSTPTFTNSVYLGANETVAITSTFTAPPGRELRLAWNDRLTIEAGAPEAADNVVYSIRANDILLGVQTVPSIPAAALGSTMTAHNVTWMPFGTGEAELVATNVGNTSTLIYLVPGQDVRLQDLGPVVNYVAAVPPAPAAPKIKSV